MLRGAVYQTLALKHFQREGENEEGPGGEVDRGCHKSCMFASQHVMTFYSGHFVYLSKTSGEHILESY